MTFIARRIVLNARRLLVRATTGSVVRLMSMVSIGSMMSITSFLACSAKDESCRLGAEVSCTCNDPDKGTVKGKQVCGAGGIYTLCKCGGDEPNIDPFAPTDPPKAKDDAGDDTAPPKENDPEPRGPAGTVSIAAGAFTMGCDGGTEVGCRADARPAHPITLAAYEIHVSEVSQAEYATCVAAGTCQAPKGGCAYDPATRGDFPVTCVSWDDAKAYCGSVSMRLPSEAEWERAARGDASADRFYPWGNDPPDCQHANFFGVKGCELPATRVVGLRESGASPYGALDMAGNVWEWTNDHYDAGYYATSPASNPTGPSGGSARVLRGGSFASGTASLQVTYREGVVPETATREIGFRCAKSK